LAGGSEPSPIATPPSPAGTALSQDDGRFRIGTCNRNGHTGSTAQQSPSIAPHGDRIGVGDSSAVPHRRRPRTAGSVEFDDENSHQATVHLRPEDRSTPSPVSAPRKIPVSAALQPQSQRPASRSASPVHSIHDPQNCREQVLQSILKSPRRRWRHPRDRTAETLSPSRDRQGRAPVRVSLEASMRCRAAAQRCQHHITAESRVSSPP